MLSRLRQMYTYNFVVKFVIARVYQNLRGFLGRRDK